MPSMPLPNAETDCPLVVDVLAVSEGTVRTEAVSTHGRVGRGKNKKYADFENTKTRRKDQAEALDEGSKGVSGAVVTQGGVCGDSSAAKGILESGPGSHQSQMSAHPDDTAVKSDHSSSCNLPTAASTTQPHGGLIVSTISTSPSSSVPVPLYTEQSSSAEVSTMFAQENGDGGLVKG